MRKTAIVPAPTTDIKRVMLFESPDGVYVFKYDTLEDSEGLGDDWFETTASAEASCFEEYNIQLQHWQLIADPLEGCQHDWIQPVRVKGRDANKPEWGRMERLVDGQWQKFGPKS